MMTQTKNAANLEIVELTGRLIGVYVANNPLPVAELPVLIESVHATLDRLAAGPEAEPEVVQKPAVPVRRSISADHLVCLEDGKKFKSLKRHLSAVHGMTPQQYREKWGLPDSYPMVAPDYSAARSQLARSSGLGRKKE